MQQHNILIEILLRLREYPPLKIHKIKSLIRQSILHQPLNIVREVGLDLLWVEYPINHVTAEQSHLDFVF